MRLSTVIVQQIKDKVRNGKSLNEISKELQITKTTVYYWYRKFSNKRIKRVKLNDNAKTLDIGEFIGIFAGDGSFYLDKNYRYDIRIHLDTKYKNYVNHVNKLIKHLFRKKPWIYDYKPNNVTIVRIISKDVLNFIKTYLTWETYKTGTIRLKDRINYNKEFYVGFLKGLIDTDGYIDKNTITFSTISYGLSSDIDFGLNKLKINHKIYLQNDKRPNIKPIYRVRISKDFNKLIYLIKPNKFKYD